MNYEHFFIWLLQIRLSGNSKSLRPLTSGWPNDPNSKKSRWLSGKSALSEGARFAAGRPKVDALLLGFFGR
jgi:hypothetical protein